MACASCRGTVRNKRYSCAVHGECVPATDCPACPDRLAFPEITTRHLLYHVYPRRGSRWRTRVLRMRERLDLFNGRRVVAVAEDGTTETVHHVERELDGSGCEVFAVPNDPNRREGASLIPLFERVQTLDPTHATVYAHAKGVTRPLGATCHRWAEVLEDVMFGHWPAVADVLRHYPIAGCFKKMGRGWAAHESLSDWHYSGSWFAVRNAALFSRPEWRRHDPFWSTIETYPSLHFAAHEAGALVHTAPVPRMNLYDARYWADTIEPLYAKFRARFAPAASTGPAPVRVELGGGSNPRGAGWINVDRAASADIITDLETQPLPFADASVDEIYSAHCLEHITNLIHVLREIARVCRVGATVEIRVPHWLGEMAKCHGHVQTIGDEQVKHWCESAVPYWFGDSPRALRLVRTERVPSAYHAEARTLFPTFTDGTLSRCVPDTFHENCYTFTVVAR